MKKIITLLMLLAMVLGGSGLAEAKGKKVSRTRTTQTTGSSSFSAATLLYKPNGLICFRKGISSKLTSMGFKKSGKTFTKSGIRVELSDVANPTQIIIYFDDTTSRNNFINSTKSFGLQWNGLECVNGWENCMAVSVEGNCVTLTGIYG